MQPLRILITNLRLAGRTGTELYVRDLAVGLLRRGHHPVAYSPRLGPLAIELRDAGVPVVDDVRKLTDEPDVVHGHQHPETMRALWRFSQAPGLYVCHDRMDWHSRPPRFPRILRYVAVDHNCRERILAAGVPEDRVHVVFNGVDLERFVSRKPLPPQPRRALLFSNDASDGSFLPAVREACVRAGVELNVAGKASGQSVARPESILGDYDLVFGKGRCALEAMAVGAAVVLLDLRGAGPMVALSELERLRRMNFGMRVLTEPIRPDFLAAQIARYDPADAAQVSRWVRSHAGLDAMVDSLLGLYAEVRKEGGAPPDRQAERAALAEYRREIGLLGRMYCGFYRSRAARVLVGNQVARWPLVGRPLRWLWLRLLVRPQP
jgi:glycosyltransferase involved in cell wall biosynthesis